VIAPRLLIAGICLPFLFSGVAKLLDFNGAVAEFSAFFSFPALLAALTIALQLGASIAATALRSTWAILAALALAAFTVAATVLAHSHQPIIFIEHLSIAFALAFVAWWYFKLRGQP
jgi:DoxX